MQRTVPEQRLDEIVVPIDEADIHLLIHGEVADTVQQDARAARAGGEVGPRGEALQDPNGGGEVALLANGIRLEGLQLQQR
ncbi:MAG: hypothetical protein QUU85_11030 [Candidatus Eisenbacteria bacterium]|nr:hypothetical protein [Candidatus Eisenbacteria bacterium]